jgi:hypothetical protein
MLRSIHYRSVKIDVRGLVRPFGARLAERIDSRLPPRGGGAWRRPRIRERPGISLACKSFPQLKSRVLVRFSRISVSKPNFLTR